MPIYDLNTFFCTSFLFKNYLQNLIALISNHIKLSTGTLLSTEWMQPSILICDDLSVVYGERFLSTGTADTII